MSEESGPVLVTRHLDDGVARPDVEELEQRLGIVTTFVGGILFEIDEDGRYVAVWTGQPELLFMPPEVMQGRSVADVVGPEFGAHFAALCQRVRETGRPEVFEYVLDVPAGRRNFRGQVCLTPRKRSDGPQTFTLLVRDVSEETRLRAMLVEAERLAAMGLVAASVGHEIRQPLAFATTSLEVLATEILRAGAPSQRALEALTHVSDAVRRIGGIAANVGIVAPDRQRDMTTDVRRPIGAALDLCASELQGRAKISVEVPDLPRVHANEGELCQVIANLLLNAAHAVEPGRTPANRIDIKAKLVDSSKNVRITVEDDGCGIDPANVERVFDAFFTTKAPGRGTGLGLFVSKRIIEESGGSLAIDSTLHGGTTVTLTLPVVVGEVALPSAYPARSERRLSILVVDDEPAFLRSLQLLLEDAHDVVVCSRSRDALDLVRKDPRRFDAILCDLSMPEIDGVAFYGQLEAIGVADRFVLMTAGAFTPHGEAFLRGARWRIAKPFTPEKLFSVLAGVTAR
ncbi:MAG: Histidine kinase [Labilithrix sp.]|nr:Histidine kinase [Labilithrix sp.]